MIRSQAVIEYILNGSPGRAYNTKVSQGYRLFLRRYRRIVMRSLRLRPFPG